MTRVSIQPLSESRQHYGHRIYAFAHKTEKAFLYEFKFSKINLNGKVFDGISEEWLSFIIKNRIQGGIQHNYDFAQGPVANDRIHPTITLFLNSRYDVEYTLKKLAFFKPNNQLSIYSSNALPNLVLKRESFVEATINSYIFSGEDISLYCYVTN